MAETKLIRDHHLLTRNLKLNGKYISNDGGDEGLTIDNDGIVTASSQIDIGNMSLTTSELDISSGSLVLDVAADITLDSNSGYFYFQKANASSIFSFVDIDNRRQSWYYDLSNYCSLTVAANGITTLATVDASAGEDAMLTLDADGPVRLDSHTGVIDFADQGLNLLVFTSDGAGNWTIKTSVANKDISFPSDSGTAILAIDKSAANVGIRCADPVSILEVRGPSTDTTTGCTGILTLSTALTDINALDQLGRINFQAPKELGGTDAILPGAAIWGEAEATFASGLNSTAVVFGVHTTDNAVERMRLTSAGALKLSYDASNYADISVASDGHLELATTGDDGDITLDAAGDIHLEYTTNLFIDGHLNLESNKYIYFDSSATKIGSNADDPEDMVIEADQDILMSPDNHLVVAAGGHVEFDGCGVGFDKETATFSTSPIDSDANDSTDVDFRLGNKYELTLTDDISGSSEFINLIFPATSGNFILVLIQGVADCTVANAGWIAYQSDGSTKALNSAGNDQADGRVRWAGGSAPTLSTAQYDVDIISFYWDADNQTAFAVASLDF